MFFLYLFYRLRLSKVSQSVSNKSYLILSYLMKRMQSKRHGVQSLLHLAYSFMDLSSALRLARSFQETVKPATANTL